MEIDLFENIEALPEDLKAIINKYADDSMSYDTCELFLKEVEKVGYTFEYSLDAQPFGLRKIRNANLKYRYYVGSDIAHPYLLGVYLTDGVLDLANQESCFWFLDIIASVQSSSKVRNEEFQVWRLKRVQNLNFLVSCSDGGKNDDEEKIVYEQDIPISDFELDILTLYFENKVISLPSER